MKVCRGLMAARTLASLGADVVKVESPDGDVSRRMGPFPDDVPHPEKSALFLALNAGKRGVTLDLESEDGRARFMELAAESQVMLDNHPPGWLTERGIGYKELAAVREDIILCQVTPFGNWGPYAKYDAGDLSLFHMSANAHGMLGPVEDPNSEPAIRAGGYQSEQVAGMAAATSTLTALFATRMSGRGCHIVVSAFEAMATQAIAGLSNIAFGGDSPTRDLAEVREASIGGQVSAIGGVLPCNDGYVAHISARGRAVGALAGADGKPGLVGRPEVQHAGREAEELGRTVGPAVGVDEPEVETGHSARGTATTNTVLPGEHGEGPDDGPAPGRPTLLRANHPSGGRRIEVSGGAL